MDDAFIRLIELERRAEAMTRPRQLDRWAHSLPQGSQADPPRSLKRGNRPAALSPVSLRLRHLARRRLGAAWCGPRRAGSRCAESCRRLFQCPRLRGAAISKPSRS
jgi:hypothetical protein